MFRLSLSGSKQYFFGENGVKRMSSKSRYKASPFKTLSFYGMPFSPPVQLVDILGSDADVDEPWEECALDNEVDSFLGGADISLRYGMRVPIAQLSCLLSSYQAGRHKTSHQSESFSDKTRKNKCFLPKVQSWVSVRVREKSPYIYICGCPCRETYVSETTHLQMCKGLASGCGACGEKLIYSHKIRQVAGKRYSLLPATKDSVLKPHRMVRIRDM